MAAIPLGPPSLAGSSNLPGSCNGAGHAILPYLVLLHVGFSLPARVTAAAVRSYRTISPLPDGREPARRYIFCGTDPWNAVLTAPPRPLAGTLPYGDRTFLGASPRASRFEEEDDAAARRARSASIFAQRPGVSSWP